MVNKDDFIRKHFGVFTITPDKIDEERSKEVDKIRKILEETIIVELNKEK